MLFNQFLTYCSESLSIVISAFKIDAAKTKDKILIQFSNQVKGGAGINELLKPRTIGMIKLKKMKKKNHNNVNKLH